MDVDNVGRLCMCGGRGIWEISVPWPRFYSEPKSALKHELKKKKYIPHRNVVRIKEK